MLSKPTALILDLGGVFCNFSAHPDAPVPPKQLKYILESPEWQSLESGRAAAPEVYRALAGRFALAEGALEETVRLASSTLVLNDDLVAAVRKLKQDHAAAAAAAGGGGGPPLRVVAATNMSHDSYTLVRARVHDGWDVFDDVFTSARLGVRKPERAFYDRVLAAAGLAAEATVFVDDRPENVICAQCHGIRSVLFKGTDSAVQTLQAWFGQDQHSRELQDPVRRGKAWLRAHAKDMWCVTNTGVEVREQFQQLFLLHLTDDWDLVDIGQVNPPKGRWNAFSYGPPVLTTDSFPDDLDTTSMALLTLDIDDKVKQRTMDDMLQCMNPDGYAYCYFDTDRPRLDPFISANVLRVFYANGRGDQLQPARRSMEDMLRTGAFEHGTRYYPLPDVLLYYLSELCVKNPGAAELDALRGLVRWRLQERMGLRATLGPEHDDDAASAAFRLIACNNMCLANNHLDRRILLDAQHGDGKWTGYMYRFGSSGVLLGSEGLITALAVAALQGAQGNTQ